MKINFIKINSTTAGPKRSLPRAQPKEVFTLKIGQGSFAALSHGCFSSSYVAAPNTPPGISCQNGKCPQ